MGMAASQARYLALVARKSNCEYEGQQINQARTALSNQSANLFNQMLGLNVPIPPSTQDFTMTQYSYTDGVNESVISSWEQLSETDPDYNYVVTHHYFADRFTGAQKKLSDPQIQFSGGAAGTNGQEVTDALREVNETYAAYEAAKQATAAARAEAAKLSNYENKDAYKISAFKSYDSDTDAYTITAGETPTDYTFVNYAKLGDADKTAVDEAIAKLIETGALPEDVNKNSLYYNAAGKDITFKESLNDLYGSTAGGTSTILPVFDTTEITTKINTYNTAIQTALLAEGTALANYNNKVEYYESLNSPTYVGNCELTLLTELTKDQQAEINQIIEDMKAEGIDDKIKDCFSPDGQYTGGIYTFKLNGLTYYTTFDDLTNSYQSGSGNNLIDGQAKLPYYNATYISTKIEETEKALLETDGAGRFSSVRFENDSVTYTLNMETITDDVAYQDAMNQYYYDNAVYDKTVQDINAKTSIIQHQDQQLELRLKQLDTEQNALKTEMEAVKKIVTDNISESFKTFGG